jgi:hypothetical protein
MDTPPAKEVAVPSSLIVGLTFDDSVAVGDIITAVSIFVAAIGLMYTVLQDRLLRRREYADRIRTAAAETAVGLERWKQLSLRLYDDVQPLLTDADSALVKSQDPVEVRDTLWRGLVGAASVAQQRVSDEKIEVAYLSLYGYDSAIQHLFADVTKALRSTDDSALAALLSTTQDDVLRLENNGEPYRSAQLGNQLRASVAAVRHVHSTELDRVISPLRGTLLSLINESDGDLRKRQKRLRLPVPE